MERTPGLIRLRLMDGSDSATVLLETAILPIPGEDIRDRIAGIVADCLIGTNREPLVHASISSRDAATILPASVVEALPAHALQEILRAYLGIAAIELQ